jgi:hypothetical protein
MRGAAGRLWQHGPGRINRERLTMKKYSLQLLALLIILMMSATVAACGGDEDGGNAGPPPSQTVQSFVEAVNRGDYDRIYDLHSAPIQQEFTRDELARIIKSVYPEGTRLEDFEVVSEVINGNKATVTYKVKIIPPGAGAGGEAQEKSVGLLLENQDWKLN